MSDLVMDVKQVSASRSGREVLVQVKGEQANSRDKVYADQKVSGDTADVYVRAESASGMGIQITGPFSLDVRLQDAPDVKTVRVHARNGVKTTRVN